MKVTPKHTEECKRLLTLMGIPYVEVRTQVMHFLTNEWCKRVLLSHSLPLSLSLSLSRSLSLSLSLSLSAGSSRLHAKQKPSVLPWSKQVLSMLLLQRTWTHSHLVQTSCSVISQLVKQSMKKFYILTFAINSVFSYRKLPIREIHLDKLLRELGINQKEVHTHM